MRGHGGPVRAIAVAPDGASAGDDRSRVADRLGRMLRGRSVNHPLRQSGTLVDPFSFPPISALLSAVYWFVQGIATLIEPVTGGASAALAVAISVIPQIFTSVFPFSSRSFVSMFGAAMIDVPASTASATPFSLSMSTPES